MNDTYLLGVDIGGSHITAALVDTRTFRVYRESLARQHVDRYGTADDILDTWSGAITAVADRFPQSFSRIGIAMPGPFDYTRGISLITGFDKYEALYQMNIGEALSRRTGIPVSGICFRNDAEAYLAGEVRSGAAAGFNRAIGITLGTGLGSAYNYDGVTADAELSVLPYKGEKIEEFVSTRGIVRAYEEAAGIKVGDARAVTDKAETDVHAKTALQIFTADLSWFLDYFIRKHHPDVIVVGGNIARAWNLFIPDTIRQLGALVSNIPIKPAVLGEDAMLIGAACCHTDKQNQH